MLTIEIPKVKLPPTVARYEWKVVKAVGNSLTVTLNEIESKTDWEIFTISGSQIILRRSLLLPIPNSKLEVAELARQKALESVISQMTSQELREALIRLKVMDRRGVLLKSRRKAT